MTIFQYTDHVMSQHQWVDLNYIHPFLPKKSHEFENRHEIFNPNLGAKSCLFNPTKYIGRVQGHWSPQPINKELNKEAPAKYTWARNLLNPLNLVAFVHRPCRISSMLMPRLGMCNNIWFQFSGHSKTEEEQEVDEACSGFEICSMSCYN
jgi:hypothetical protein